MYQYTDMLILYQYTNIPVYQCTKIPIQQYINIPVYLYTIVSIISMYKCTNILNYILNQKVSELSISWYRSFNNISISFILCLR